jgi:HD superfamily phosphohydrolase
MSSQRKHIFPDPIAGKIELPLWLVKIKEEPAVRRMLFIRQLGLKAYIDFPGAIHTRYSHALGAMYLAKKTTDLLFEKMHEKNRSLIENSLRTNEEELIAAGFLHDIAHGPFSHAVDFALRKISGKTHEEVAKDIILNNLPPDLENWINREQVIKLIKGNHDYPFLSQIISGPIDIDKLDYLLRDAYHVGLKYSFDLDYFLSSLTILGDENCLDKCKLGIEDSTQAVVTTELFLVMWKSMYDLVYHIEDSRVAEKMLEKAILLKENDVKIRQKLGDPKNFVELDDDKLLNLLSTLGGKSAELVNSIKIGKVYKVVFDKELDEERFQMSPEFLEALKDSHKVSELGDNISKQFNEKENKTEYGYICDIITSKAPSDIQIDKLDEETGEYLELRKKSSIVGAIQSQSRIKVYSDPEIKDAPRGEEINKTLKEIIEGLKID